MKTKITINRIPEMTIEEYVETHDLEMVVNERPVRADDPCRFYASLIQCDVKQGNMLLDATGDGSTPEQAIKDCGRAINLKTVVFRARSLTDRREIQRVRIIEPESK
jgi:hypothetical protein